MKGGKLPGLYGGTVNSGCNLPDGTNGFSTRYMWGPDPTNFGSYAFLYLYAADNAEYGADCGRNVGKGNSNFMIPKNEWHNIKQYIRLNDPGLKNPNGVAAIYFDDQLVIQETNIEYRTIDSLKIEGFMFSTFFGGSSPDWRATKDEEAVFRNIKISETPEDWNEVEIDNRVVLEDGYCDYRTSTWSEYASQDCGGLCGSGEYEKLEYFRDPTKNNGEFLDIITCDDPTGVRARKVNFLDGDTPEFKTFRADYGWMCQNKYLEEKVCDDVEVSFCCPRTEL